MVYSIHMDTTTSKTNSDLIHIFEMANLGTGPFDFVGEYDRGRDHTSCDYCGTRIRYEQIISDSTGKTFKVGNECVNKTGDTGLVSKMKLAEKARKARQKAEKLAAELEAQRQRNGGKTDQELAWEKVQAEEAAAQAKAEAARAERAAAAKEANAELLAIMQPYVDSHVAWRRSEIEQFGGTLVVNMDQPFALGTFMADIWTSLQNIPHSQLSLRQREVLADIVSKGLMREAGKRNRKPFQVEINRVLGLD